MDSCDAINKINGKPCKKKAVLEFNYKHYCTVHYVITRDNKRDIAAFMAINKRLEEVVKVAISCNQEVKKLTEKVQSFNNRINTLELRMGAF